MVAVGGVSIVVYLGGIRAAAKLHKRLLTSLLRASMRFFDVTPVGRIINRFSTDLDKLDSNIPQFTRLWLFNLATLLSILVVISYSIPVFLIAVIPLAIFYICVQV